MFLPQGERNKRQLLATLPCLEVEGALGGRLKKSLVWICIGGTTCESPIKYEQFQKAQNFRWFFRAVDFSESPFWAAARALINRERWWFSWHMARLMADLSQESGVFAWHGISPIARSLLGIILREPTNDRNAGGLSLLIPSSQRSSIMMPIRIPIVNPMITSPSIPSGKR